MTRYTIERRPIPRLQDGQVTFAVKFSRLVLPNFLRALFFNKWTYTHVLPASSLQCWQKLPTARFSLCHVYSRASKTAHCYLLPYSSPIFSLFRKQMFCFLFFLLSPLFPRPSQRNSSVSLVCSLVHSAVSPSLSPRWAPFVAAEIHGLSGTKRAANDDDDDAARLRMSKREKPRARAANTRVWPSLIRYARFAGAREESQSTASR